jgi:hypothetical protein
MQPEASSLIHRRCGTDWLKATEKVLIKKQLPELSLLNEITFLSKATQRQGFFSRI